MRRKKDDKRVLRRGNGRDNNRKRRTPNISLKGRSRANRNNNDYRNNNRNRNKKQKKRSRKTVLLMIIVLLAFIIGAGIGVILSFDAGNTNSTEANETHVENVTVEMTTNLTNDSGYVYFDEADHVDFNENQSSEILDAENNPYYNDDGLGY